jgi:hypothetical protein
MAAPCGSDVQPPTIAQQTHHNTKPVIAVMDAHRSFLSSLLRESVFVQIFVAVTAIAVCTRVLSGHWFSQVKNGRQCEIAPPTLPHWTPGLRHALRMAHSAKRFLAQSL